MIIKFRLVSKFNTEIDWHVPLRGFKISFQISMHISFYVSFLLYNVKKKVKMAYNHAPSHVNLWFKTP